MSCYIVFYFTVLVKIYYIVFHPTLSYLLYILYYSTYFKLIWGWGVSAELDRILRCLQYRAVPTLPYLCVQTPGTFLGSSVLSPDLSLQAPPDSREACTVRSIYAGSQAVHELRKFRGSTLPIYATKHFLLVSVTAIGGSGWTGCSGTAECSQQGTDTEECSQQGTDTVEC
jgi:hypothetical protein